MTVNFTVTVNSPGSGTPSGNVTVSDGAASCTASVAAGTCNLKLKVAGTRTLTATYAGYANFNSSSDTESHQVNSRTASFRSQGAYNGWLLESGENSNAGGSINATATTFIMGDDVANKQYRTILSFNTANLPDSAVITKVTLKIRKQGLVGTNPFTTHGNILVDVRKGAFGGSNALQLTDFQAAASKNAAGTIKNTPSSGWYPVTFNSSAFTYINLTGMTQFRLRFQLDDNDDLGADYLKFYSGNYSSVSLHPLLVIEYYVP